MRRWAGQSGLLEVYVACTADILALEVLVLAEKDAARQLVEDQKPVFPPRAGQRGIPRNSKTGISVPQPCPPASKTAADSICTSPGNDLGNYGSEACPLGNSTQIAAKRAENCAEIASGPTCGQGAALGWRFKSTSWDGQKKTGNSDLRPFFPKFMLTRSWRNWYI